MVWKKEFFKGGIFLLWGVGLLSAAEYQSPAYIVWEKTTAETVSLLEEKGFQSQFSMKRGYRIENAPQDHPQVQTDINRTIQDVWQEQTIRPLRESCYSSRESLVYRVQCEKGVPIPFYLDDGFFASEVVSGENWKDRMVARSIRDGKGLSQENIPKKAVAILAWQRTEAFGKYEKEGYHATFVSEKMLQSATITPVSEQMAILGIGPMEYSMLVLEKDSPPLQKETVAFLDRFQKQGGKLIW